MTFVQTISSRINLMRILLIGGIVFVHVAYDAQTSPLTGAFGAFDWLRVFLGESKAATVLTPFLLWTGSAFPLWLIWHAICFLSSEQSASGFGGMLIETRFGRRLAGTGSWNFWIFCGHYPFAGRPVDVVEPNGWRQPLSGSSGDHGDLRNSEFTNRIVATMAPATYRVLTGSRARDRRAAVLQADPGSKANETPAGAALRPQRGEA